MDDFLNNETQNNKNKKIYELARKSVFSTISSMTENSFWFSCIISEMSIKLDTVHKQHHIDTAGVVYNEKMFMPVLIVNPYFWIKLHITDSPTIPEGCNNTSEESLEKIYKANSKKSIKKRIGVLKHEALHLVLNHHKRIKFLLDQEKAQIASDLETNCFISADELPEGHLRSENFNLPSNMTLEWYYDHIPPFSKMENLLIAKIGKKNIEFPSPSNDVFPTEDLEEISKQICDRANEMTKRSRGTIPSDLKELVDSIHQGSKIDWKTQLQYFASMMHMQKLDRSFRRPDKRVKNLIPARKRIPSPQIAVAVDTSGSISSENLSEFTAEIKKIAESFGGVVVIQNDAAIHQIKEILVDEIENHSWEWHGRGGTDFQPIFDWCIENQILHLVFLTDGYAPAPDCYGVHTVWVLTKESKNDHLQGPKIFLP